MTDVKSYLRCTWWGKILGEHDTEPTELSGGLAKTVLGAKLIFPGDTFTHGAAGSVFQDFAFLPDWAWGVILLSLGVAHLCILQGGNRQWRRWASFAGSVLWIAVWATFLHGSIQSWTAWFFLLAGLWQCWCYVRLRV